MTITKTDFDKADLKVITLIGMSGVGKTYLSMVLERQGWFHYSCDLEIGTRYLGAEIEKTLGVKNTITAADISQLSDYLGFLGQGGLPLEEFKRRQTQYIKAESQALYDLKNVVKQAVEKGCRYILNDSPGSLCEIEDKGLLEEIAENSLIVYIKADKEGEKQVLKRAQDYPKPLFFSPEKFDNWVEEYASLKNLASSNEFDSKDFSRWVFPKLFENRLPKYQAIADQYGVTIPSKVFQGVASAEEFLDIIRGHLPDEYE